MNRRRVLSVIGTVTLGAGAVFLAYQADQGNIDLGEESEVSAEVYDEPESFEFDASAGDDIFISIRETSAGDGTGSFVLSNPDGVEVEDRRLAGSDTDEQHTAEQTGTFRLTVDPRETRLQVSVSVVEREE
jgi:hypothetical protein